MTAIDSSEPASFDAAVTRPDEDLLGIQPYAARLAEFIDKLNPPFTIGVYGAWGSGKTTFVRLMEGELRKTHPDLKFIVFEAWPFKTSDDLWRALVQQIAYAIHGVTEPAKAQKSEPPAESFATRLGRRLREPALRFRRDPEPPPPFAEYYDLLQRLDDTRYGGVRSRAPGQLLDEEGAVTALVQGTVAALGNLSPLVAAMRTFFGFDSKVDVAKLLQQEKNETTRNRIKSVEDFRKAVAELFEKPGTGKVCVFIDDLDRCMPDVALDLLEALKIFLGHTRCIFIVAADEQLIGEGLRIRYKELLAIPRADTDPQLFPRKGKEYFEKIIQLGIRVPDHAAPHVHRFIAAQFPQWLTSTDLIQGAVGSNPRRLKQYCTWLDYKYMVARDPKAADDWPLLTKLVELRSRSADAVEALRQLAQESRFPELMKRIEAGSRDEIDNDAALTLYDLAAENRSIRRVLEAQPRFSEGGAGEIAAVAGFVDVTPDVQSTRMLKSKDGVLIRLFEKQARTGAPTAEEILSDDLAKLNALVKLDPDLDAILEQLAGRDDWSDVMDSVQSSLQGGPNARQPHAAAARLVEIAKANDEVRKKLIEPESQLSAVLPQIVQAWARSPGGIPTEEAETITDALAVRLRAARHFVNRRKFVKLDALGHSWPDLFQYVQTDKPGLRTFEANVTDPNQRPQDLPELWQPYVRDEKLMAFLHLRPFLADLLDEEVTAIASLTASVVRPSEAASPVVQTPQPTVPPPTTLSETVVPPAIVAQAAAAAEQGTFVNTLIEILERDGQYQLALHGERGARVDKALSLDVAELRELAESLREFLRSRRQDIAGRLREFGAELYQLFFAGTAFDAFLMAAPRRRFCFSVPPELQFLPWELLCVPSSGLFLGLSPHHSLVRFVRPPNDRRSLGPIGPPLRILAFLGKPGESPPRLREEDGLLSQLSISAGHVTLEILSGEKATFSELEKAVRVQQPHVLHFSGYRDADTVMFIDTVVPRQAFINWLARSRVRLVDFTGCYVPPGGKEDSPSLAWDLAKSGVPMVINTTSPITSEAVLVFTRDFYRTLAEGRSIEEALVEARQSQSKEQWDWSAFALYSSEPALGDLSYP